MRTSMRCEKMSALWTFIETTESFGASSLKVDAQPPTRNDAPSNAIQARARLGMVEHVGRHQHDALVGDQEALRVLRLVVADTGAWRQFAVGVDDGVLDVAVGADAHIRQYHRTLDHRFFLDTHAGEQQ